MAVLEPLKVTIVNLPPDCPKTVSVPNFPANESKGFHEVPFANTIFIEQSDFREVGNDSCEKSDLTCSLEDAESTVFYQTFYAKISCCYYVCDTSVFCLAGARYTHVLTELLGNGYYNYSVILVQSTTVD